MRALLVSRSVPPDVGGYQRQFSLLLPRLAEQCPIWAVGSVRQAPDGRRLGWPGVRTLAFPSWRLPHRVRGGADVLVMLAAVFLAVVERLASRRCVLILLSPTMIGAGLLLAVWTRLGCPALVRFPTEGDAKVLAARSTTSWIDVERVRWIVMTPAQAAEVEEVLGVRPEIIANAVQESASTREDGHKRFVVVGRLIRRKRVGLVLDAWGEVEAELDGTELHVIGSGQDARDSVEEELRARVESGTLRRVRIRGEVPDARCEIVGAMALIHASVLEGLPNSVLEAMAAGVPVVAAPAETDRWFDDPPPTVAWDGQTVESLADALRKVASQGPTVSTIASRAQRQIGRLCSVGAAVDRYTDLLQGSATSGAH